jgi:uncharacterized membrane protein
LVARECGLLALVAAITLLESVASIIRQVHLQSGIDTAIFDQAVWHYSRFEAPYSSIKFGNLLGDHFHPVVALLAPLYWIWSDPRMLLIAQSLLVAVSIIPVFLFAESRLGRPGAYLLAGAYAAFWGLQVGVLFEFHEVAFAPLLIALAILLADRRRWGWFWVVVVLLLCVKEDLSIFVAFLGLYLLTRREVRHGIALVVVGIAWYELATRVFIPHFAHGHGYEYWSYGELGNNPLDAIWALVQAPWRVFTIGFSPAQKWHTMVELLAPFLFLSLWSRLFLLAVPLFAERFLSTTHPLWTASFHYSLAIAPVLAMAAAAGLANLVAALQRRRGLPERRTQATVVAAAVAMLVTSLAITKLASTDSALSRLTQGSFYSSPSYAAAAYRALRHVPAGGSLATVDAVLPHASERARIQQIEQHTIGADEYVLANIVQSTCCGVSGNGTFAALGQVLDAELSTVTPIYYDAGWLLARRPPKGQPATSGVLEPMRASTASNVDRLAFRWGGALEAIFPRVLVCYEQWLARDSAAAACFAAGDRRLQALQPRLAASIAAAVPALRGGCWDLAHAALAATSKFARNLRQLDSAAASTDRAALPAATALVHTDVAGLDLSDQLARFVILCTPRPGSARGST